MNSNDHGFGVFVIDDKSIRFYEENLSIIDNQLNKAVVIGQLLIMMRQILYPATRLPLILNQMMDEPNQNLINAVYMALVSAQSMYLPPENVQKFNKEVADFFIRKAIKEQEDKKLQSFCLDKALGFVFDKENLSMAAQWIETSQVQIGDQTLSELTANQKYAILQNYYASSYFNTDQKKALKEKTFAGDESDKAKKVELQCDQSLPDPEQKERIWATVTDLDNTETLQSIQIKLSGFFRRNQQLDLIEPYFTKYFDMLGMVVDRKDREYAEAFMNTLSPAFMATEQIESQFREYLRNPVYQDRNFFVLFLKKQMEIIETVRKSRKLCESSMLD